MLDNGVNNCTIDLAKPFHFKDVGKCLSQGLVKGDGISNIEGPALFYVCLM